MIRRQFMQRVTAAAGATAALAVGGAAKAAVKAEESSSVTFHVKGFTCVTCAIGLGVVLRQQDGVVRAKAFYEEGKVEVLYDPERTSPEALRDFMNRTTGFTVTFGNEG